MIKMATTYIPQRQIPFTTVVDLDSVTTAAGVVTWVTIPVYNVEWIRLVITSTASGNTGNVIVTPNATGGHITATTANIASGATEEIWVLVRGQQVGPTANLAYGSTSLTIATQDGTGHAVLSGYYELHGLRIA
jgi:hypothetical protein